MEFREHLRLRRMVAAYRADTGAFHRLYPTAEEAATELGIPEERVEQSIQVRMDYRGFYFTRLFFRDGIFQLLSKIKTK
ncbi:MAG: hypothetical protein IKP00_07120 [Victivallales bacterium]|nr:hypothetical protein [Victivallales bacterium]